MKKNSFLFVSLLLPLMLAGCSNNATSNKNNSTVSSSVEASSIAVENIDYTVTVEATGEGSKKGITVDFVKDGKTIQSGTSDRKGLISVTLPKDTYTLVASNLEDGYYQTQDVTTGSETSYTVSLSTGIIDKDLPEGNRYYKGSIIYDDELTITDGTSMKFSQMLSGKEAIVLNFWGVTCPYCVAEMPDLSTYYSQHESEISLIGINSYTPLETNDMVDAFLEENNLSFPVTYYTEDLVSNFNVTAFPTTIVIDRYGRVANTYAGYVSSLEGFERLIGSVLGDSYTPSY